VRQRAASTSAICACRGARPRNFHCLCARRPSGRTLPASPERIAASFPAGTCISDSRQATSPSWSGRHTRRGQPASTSSFWTGPPLVVVGLCCRRWWRVRHGRSAMPLPIPQWPRRPLCGWRNGLARSSSSTRKSSPSSGRARGLRCAPSRVRPSRAASLSTRPAPGPATLRGNSASRCRCSLPDRRCSRSQRRMPMPARRCTPSTAR
jgi:hypothetical protein